MIKVVDLENKIREQAGEIEILRIREAGLQDDIRILKEQLDAKEVEAKPEAPPKRK